MTGPGTRLPAPPVPTPGTRSIGAEVRSLVTNVVKLANHLGDSASGDLLAAQARAADTSATIVVAGEAKQGKSSLVNALIGAEGLSPVDADIATAVPLRIAYGAKLSVTLTLTTGEYLVIAPAELPSWVSMVDAELDQLRRVRAVDVALLAPLLEPGVVLIDTPGVGGLVAGHATMTLHALESATAMLFVTDADTKLTRPELEFLARAGERIAAVIFVISKIDATPDWKQVRDENRAVLARYAPRYAEAPMLGVSTRLAMRARAVAATDRPLSANLWAESGLGQLQSWVSRRIRPVATTLAVANTVAMSRSTLDRLAATAQRNLAATTADPAVTAAFEAEKRRVAELRSEQMTWGTTLERRLFEARTLLRDQIRVSSENLRATGAELIKSMNKSDTSQIVVQTDAELDAQAQALSAALRRVSGAVCAELLSSLNIASPLQLSVAHSGAVNVRHFESSSTLSMNLLTSGMSAAMGWGVIARITTMPWVATALAPLGLGSLLAGLVLPVLGGAGVGYAIHHVRGTAARRTELGAWVRNEIDRAASERYADVERVLTSAKLDITEVVRAGLIEREREVSAALDEARAARDHSHQERIVRERSERKVVDATARLSSTADELLGALLAAASLTAPNSAGIPRPDLRS